MSQTAGKEDEDIVARECRHVIYCPSKNSSSSADLHAIKEIVHYKDGRVIPKLRLVKNYKRKFWITKPAFQKHKDKKESEEIAKLQEYQCNQSDLVRSIAMALAKGGTPRTLKQACRSPYVYGADITAAALIKDTYLRKYPETNSLYSVCYLDTETDVIHGTEKIICSTISFKKKIKTFITNDMVKGYAGVMDSLKAHANRLAGDLIKKRELEWEFVMVPDDARCVIEMFKTLHEWAPDFVAIWNMDFDVPKMLGALQSAGIDPADVMCDPSIPAEFRYVHYKQGPSQKKMASGKVSPILPWARWHTLYVPAKYYVIDAMCAYKQVRLGAPEKSSYSLDAILREEKVGIQKLDIEEAKHLDGLAWHKFMQSNHPLEYIIYNGVDCVAGEMLDEVTNDLSVALPMLAGCSEFDNVKSQPRRLVDQLHNFMIEEEGHVIATTSDEMGDDEDMTTIDGVGWITMLPATQIADSGMQVLEEMPHLNSTVYRDTGDLDVTASYNGCDFQEKS